VYGLGFIAQFLVLDRSPESTPEVEIIEIVVWSDRIGNHPNEGYGPTFAHAAADRSVTMAGQL
jgi:hypothetical protein